MRYRVLCSPCCKPIRRLVHRLSPQVRAHWCTWAQRLPPLLGLIWNPFWKVNPCWQQFWFLIHSCNTPYVHLLLSWQPTWMWLQSLQAPYLAGSGTYAADGISTCTSPTTTANAIGSKPLGWTTLSPMNDQGLATALLSQPVKVCQELFRACKVVGPYLCIFPWSGWDIVRYPWQDKRGRVLYPLVSCVLRYSKNGDNLKHVWRWAAVLHGNGLTLPWYHNNLRFTLLVYDTGKCSVYGSS